MRNFPHKSAEKTVTVQLLIQHGADVKAQDDTHTAPLHLASSLGIPEIVQLLIDHGADVIAQDWMRRTPLHLASSLVSSKLALLSIKDRADLYGQDDSDREPDRGNSHAKPNIVMLLIDHGADVTAQDEAQSTPLHLASSIGGVETVRLLIDHGADVTSQDGNRKTPLHLASSRVSIETVHLLVQRELMFKGRKMCPKRIFFGKSPMTRLISCRY